MVTGCDHLVSPVPIHPPLNSSFDTLRPLLAWVHLTWSPPFWKHKDNKKKHLFKKKKEKRKENLHTHKTHPTRTFDLLVAGRVSRVSPLDISLWNPNVQLPFFMAPCSTVKSDLWLLSKAGMKDKLIFPSQVYILGIWTADLALTSTEVLVSCLLMLMCLCLEMNGAVTEIYLYSRSMAVPPDPEHCTSLRWAPAYVTGSQQMTLSFNLENCSVYIM